ncbi:MAG TPA: hypothetical protein VFX60_06295 [Micromonospora sp.]|nr:hypothetical protein [Micromonospora sp.]
MRRSRPLVLLAALCLAAPAAPAVAAPSASPDDEVTRPVFTIQTGELDAGQQGRVEFTVGQDDFTAAAGGRVLIGFMLQPAPDSGLDPGRITVTSESGSSTATLFHGLDTPGAVSSFTIVELSVGATYQVTLGAEKSTSGAYELSTYLAGDANGDFQVNHDDLTLVESLSVTKYGQPGYVGWADLNRNGVINHGLSGGHSVHLGRRETGIDDALRTS